MNPIEAAVMPLKEQAIERAEKNAKERIENVRKGLEISGNNLSECAPYPKNNQSRADFAAQHACYWLYRKLTDMRDNVCYNKNIQLADMSEKKCKKFIEEEKSEAADQYDKFVLKLVTKIGKTKSATLKGNHVWDFSILDIVLQNGESEKWKTQQIVNVSVHGKLFNQWPSRKLKGEK